MRVISKAALVVNLVNDASAAEPKPSPVEVLTTPAFEHPAPRRPEIYAVMGIVPCWRFTGKPNLPTHGYSRLPTCSNLCEPDQFTLEDDDAHLFFCHLRYFRRRVLLVVGGGWRTS